MAHNQLLHMWRADNECYQEATVGTSCSSVPACSALRGSSERHRSQVTNEKHREHCIAEGPAGYYSHVSAHGIRGTTGKTLAGNSGSCCKGSTTKIGKRTVIGAILDGYRYASTRDREYLKIGLPAKGRRHRRLIKTRPVGSSCVCSLSGGKLPSPLKAVRICLAFDVARQ